MKHDLSQRIFSRGLAFGMSLIAFLNLSSAAIGQSKTYTTNADFDLGIFFNVNHDIPNQLQLNPVNAIVPLPFLWIANAGDDTESKFDTTQFTDSNGVSRPGKELARYRTWFAPPGPHGAFAGPAPSRTAVDGEGNVYVANRHFDGRPASVMKILFTGGIDRNGNGVIDTSTDSNGNGVIDPSEIIPLVDTNGNGFPDQSELADERVAWLVRVGPNNGLGRSLSLAPDGSIWVGLFNSREYYKLDPTDGHVLAGPISVGRNTPYGSVVDGSGRLWGASINDNLLELDTTTNLVTNVYTHSGWSDYGIALGNDGTGLRVYQASFSGARTFSKFDPVTHSFSYPAAFPMDCYGISTDPAGNIFVSGSNVSGSTRGCTKFSPSGTVIWSKAPQPGATSGDQRGAIVDANGDVWIVNHPDDRISKYKGSDGTPLGTLPTGDAPYTYSDASGQQFLGQTTQTGNWSVVFDSGRTGATWGSVNWHSLEPANTAINVQVRADDILASLPIKNFSSNLTNGASFCGLQSGRFIEVKVTFTRAPGVLEPPILFDLSVGTCPLSVTGLAARAKPGKVNLTWPGTAGSSTYKIFRKLASGGDFAQIGTSLTGIYLDTTVTNGQTYQYAVQSVVNQIASSNSNVATVLVPNPL
ncbi:MAG: hypothetical protein SFV81_03380 [Pirellulaceae bacterium]|nr:hypothetical protein [Pirellulaceae bacterium]